MVRWVVCCTDRQRAILIFELLPELSHLLYAPARPTLIDLLLKLAIQPQLVLLELLGRPDGRRRAQVVLVEGDGERVIRGEDERERVALAPILDACDVDGRTAGGFVGHGDGTNAMLVRMVAIGKG